MPGAGKRGEAAASNRRDSLKGCPARVLVNMKHPLVSAINEIFAESTTSDHSRKLSKIVNIGAIRLDPPGITIELDALYPR